MRSARKTAAVLAGILLIGASCSSRLFQPKERIYEAPKMGAEYRFEEGLKREKRPQQLFSKKERKDMEKLGMTSHQERSAPPVQIKPGGSGAGTDSTRTDSTGTPIPPVDSTRTDTTQHLQP